MEARKELGLSLQVARAAVQVDAAEVAERLGISQALYSHYEHGTRKIPATRLIEILDRLEIDSADLAACKSLVFRLHRGGNDGW
nr:helix-turn-helix transcriptional regulator [uncultured Rhodopila sp.]